MKYIVIEDQMFVYSISRYEKSTNTAFLTLYKNPNDYRAKKSLKEIEVSEWRKGKSNASCKN